jgi:sugar/nucleoside kinase (ribokinase family)
MRIICVGDLVTDYYYLDEKFIGFDGGKSVFNLGFHLAYNNYSVYAYGVCGNDYEGDIAIESLKQVGVNTDYVIKKDVNTRCLHVSIDSKQRITYMKKDCHKCGNRKWYNNDFHFDDLPEELITNEDTIVCFDIIKKDILKTIQIIKEKGYKTIIDIGHIRNLETLSNEEIVELLRGRFNIVQMNDKVSNFIIARFNINMNELMNIFNSNLVIITHGKKGATFLFDENGEVKEIKKELSDPKEEIDATGAGDAFFSVVIKNYIDNKYVITRGLIDKIFEEASILTSKVVSIIGARTIYKPLFKKKRSKNCICE